MFTSLFISSIVPEVARGVMDNPVDNRAILYPFQLMYCVCFNMKFVYLIILYTYINYYTSRLVPFISYKV